MAKKNKRNQDEVETLGTEEVGTEETTVAEASPDNVTEGETKMEATIAPDEVEQDKKVPFCNVAQEQDGSISFSFGNGHEVRVNPAELPEEQQENLTRHGLVQKVRDSFASAKGDFNYAIGAAEKVINQLKNNQWTASRGSGESKPHTGELVQALASLKGLDIAVVQAAVERASDEKRKAWRSNAEVKAEIARIRAEAARKRAETSKAEDIDLEVA